jgi:hypothetical protein
MQLTCRIVTNSPSEKDFGADPDWYSAMLQVKIEKADLSLVLWRWTENDFKVPFRIKLADSTASIYVDLVEDRNHGLLAGLGSRHCYAITRSST